MREIKTHQINECNSGLKLHAEEQLGPGGAPHRYEISFGREPRPENRRSVTVLEFQNGAIKEVGTNGITHEVLLAVLVDRLAHFQRGPYVCEENAAALTALLEAQAALHSRTKRRVEAGTEGTMQLDGPKLFKVVNTDNFGGDYPNESWIQEIPVERANADALATEWNLKHCPSGNESRIAMVVPETHQLAPGFEP